MNTSPRVLLACLALGFTYVFLANSWLGDDGYITFRVSQNFVRGYGLTFNPGERVQAYTHPLWMFLLSALYLASGDFFFTSTALSYVCCLAMLLLVFAHLGTFRRSLLFLALLLSSKAFVDYVSSGLEYPLSYLLLAAFYGKFLRDAGTGRSLRPADVAFYGLIASLGFLNRSDAILLYLGPLAYVALVAPGSSEARPLGRPRPLLALAASLAPMAIWLAFSYVYYGFPFPNTYYAKVATGIPRSLALKQGVAYLLNSVNYDPITLGAIVLAAILTIWARRPPLILCAASVSLYVLYAIWIGGDFMSGRFFALPFLVASFLIVALVREREAVIAMIGGLAAYNVIAPLAPIKTRASYDQAWDWHLQNGIKDERGYYHKITNLLFYDPLRTLPDHEWFNEGISFRNSDEKVALQGSIGYFGFNAGPEKYVIDRNALSDPLLARLPVSERLYFEFYIGHFFRDVPAGYLESCRQGKNLIEDPLIHEYYEKLINITRGPIFSASRLRDIWDLNAGRFRTFARQVDARRRVDVSIRAGNARFVTDVGERDVERGVLRSWGKAGYLQMGPGIPLKAGKYRARWIGVVEQPSGESLGFVDVWADGGERLLNKQFVKAGASPSADRVLAEIEFVLKRPTKAIDYRLYVNAGARVALERVALQSAD